MFREREKEPHFAAPGSFQYEFGMRWKQLDDMEKQRIEAVKKEMEEARIKLEDEMQNALYEFQAEQIRQGKGCLTVSPCPTKKQAVKTSQVAHSVKDCFSLGDSLLLTLN
jgi:hypothetical protein